MDSEELKKKNESQQETAVDAQNQQPEAEMTADNTPVQDDTENSEPPTETAQEEKTAEPTKRQKLNEMLSSMIEGYNPDDDEGSAEILMAHLNKNSEQTKKIAEAISKYPQLAQALSDIINGKRGAAGSLARYFGKDFMSAEEGTPEFDEIVKAEEERKKELEDATKSEKEYQDNINKSMPQIEEFCKSKGYDTDEFLGSAWDKLVGPILSGNYTPEVLDMLDKSFNYDKDVSDAMAAGEVKGRNVNISKLKENTGDGLPKGIITQVPNKIKKKRNGLLDLALAD